MTALRTLARKHSHTMTSIRPRHQRQTWSTLLLLAVLTLGLSTGCGGPRSPEVSRQQALSWHDPLEFRVLYVYDGMRHSRDPHVSHLVEVEVLRGDSQRIANGERMTLPYDEWQVGEEPPKVGTVLMTTPAQWVRGTR